MGLTQWKKFSVERLPVPRIAAVEQRRFVDLVDGIMTASANAGAEVDLDEEGGEAEIDGLVYELFGLTATEIAAVEERLEG